MSTTTRIEVCAAADGVPRVRIRTGPWQVRRLADCGATVRLGLVGTQAMLLAGDAVRMEVRVAGPVCVQIVEMAGTVAYDMRGAGATWDLAVELVDRAILSWDAQPFVVSAGAHVARGLEVRADMDTRATLRDVVVLGRSRELGGTLRSRTRIDLGGAPLLVEDLDLSPVGRAGWATLHGHRCLTSDTTVGHRLPDGPGVLQLEGPGSIHRWIGDELHCAEQAATA